MRRVDYLAGEGLARRQGRRVVFARDLINTPRQRELDAAAAKLADETGLAHRPSGDGEYVAGTFRQRVPLASGRFAHHTGWCRGRAPVASIYRVCQARAR
jgi:hypothetical protein